MKSEPTERQRRQFCEMIARAFMEVRILGWQGKSEQAAALADAFHNLPVVMYQPTFDWGRSRSFFQSYRDKYPPEPGAWFTDFTQWHDRIQADA